MSNIISSREKKIIEVLVQSEGYITTKRIAEAIDVSRRTVLRDMNNVYDWFEEQGFHIERSSKKGILVAIPRDKKDELLQQLRQENTIAIYSKRERMFYIVTELLQSKEVLKLGAFAVALEVSEATISSDLNSVDEWLKEYDLGLERKQGYGVHVDGKERNKRRALINIMYEMLDDSQLRSAVKRQIGIGVKSSGVSSKISSKLLNLMDVETISVIEKAIMTSEQELGFKLAESSYTALAVHLALALKRIQNHETISMNQDILDELVHFDEYIVAAKLIQTLRTQTDLEIPIDEIGYVTLHLKGAKYKNGMSDSSILRFNEMIISNYELTAMINKMINLATQRSGYNLKQVDSLLIGLVDHIRPAISRLQLNLEIRNPLLDKIKVQYPEIYRISEECSQIITNMIGIKLPDAEIGYIAMHIGSAIELIKNKQATNTSRYRVVVTCISGIGTSNMLAQRIRKEFNNIDIIDVFSSTTLHDDWLRKHNVDLILSTVYFDNDIVPVVTVNPLLMENDVQRIQQRLQSLDILDRPIDKTTLSYYDHMKKVQQYTSAIVELLENFTFIADIDMTDYEELLQFIAQTLSTQPDILYKEILRRESIGRIVFEKERVAFLHTRTVTRETISIGVFRLKQELIYENQSIDTVLVLLAPQEVSKVHLEIIGEISARIITDPQFLPDLRYMSEEPLYHTIEHYLFQFYQEQNK